MKTAIWWVRRDLRLFDNQALHVASTRADAILPLFIVDPALWHNRYAGQKRLAYLVEALNGLDINLRGLGGRLIVRYGKPVEILTQLRRETGAEQIFAEADFSPYARKRDQAIQRVLPLTLTGGVSIFPPDAARKADGTPYTVFTPYSRAWKALPAPDLESLLPAPQQLRTPTHIASEALPEIKASVSLDSFPTDETIARQHLHDFASGEIHAYEHQRDILDAPGTSRLSPCFRFGILSIREAAALARKAAQEHANREGAGTWLNELIWRDFYISILYHFPFVRRMSFREPLRGLEWDNNPDAFTAWQQGRTGYPVVDAAMRQLLHLGWMHNRARMITASFLTKDLLIDWRWGEEHFMQHLLDGDPAANNGGWQWSAGTGTDAAPYFRIFNPVLQGQKYDPNGDYVRHWVPELRNVPNKYIQSPWQMPDQEQRKVGVLIGKDYPAPIVDHHWARQRTLDAYKAAKAASPPGD